MKNQLTVFVLLVSLVFQSNAQHPAAQTQNKSWTISGYLHSDLSQRVYITMENQKITAVSAQKPQQSVLMTDSIIFPGLIDLHNHLKFNVYPIWQGVHGQYENRFEWRDKSAGYASYVKFNNRAFPFGTCLTVQWAELKALAGGTTSVQGIEKEEHCGANFAVRNVEIEGDIRPSWKSLAINDFISGFFLTPIYTHGFRDAYMQNGDYNMSLKQYLTTVGVTSWVQTLTNSPKDLKSALELTMGGSFDTQSGDASRETFNALRAPIRAFLISERKVAEDRADSKVKSLEAWIFGDQLAPGFLQSEFAQDSADFIADPLIVKFFSSDSVIVIPESIRKYVSDYEILVRRKFFDYVRKVPSPVLIAHFTEGMRTAVSHKDEIRLLKELYGWQNKMILIHASGLSSRDLKDLAAKNGTIVWSPLSNLMLYGETLDVRAALEAGVNVTIAPDWAPTGSKNLIDELRFARDYLEKFEPSLRLSDKDLFTMATEKPAKALGLENEIGFIKAGANADLVLIQKKTGNAYVQLINSHDKDRLLTVVGGTPMYGDLAVLQKALRVMGISTQPEEVYINTAACKVSKAFYGLDRNPNRTQKSASSYAKIKGELTAFLEAFRKDIALRTPELETSVIKEIDKLFTCDDVVYRHYVESFLEVTLKNNKEQRQAHRDLESLKDGYNPYK